MSFSETCVKSNVVYNGKIVKLHCDEASLPNGKLCTPRICGARRRFVRAVRKR